MNRSSGLRIAIRPARKGPQLHKVAAGIPGSLLMILGMSVTLCGWFPSVQWDWWLPALGMTGFTAVLWALRLTERSRMLLIASLVLVCAGSCLAFKPVLGGMACLGNDLLNNLTPVTGKIYLDFAASGNASGLWGILPLAAVCAILLQLTLETGRILFVLPGLLAVYGAVLLGIYPVDAGVMLLGIGTIMLVMQSAAAKQDVQSWSGLPSWLLILLVCLLTAGGIGLAAGDGTVDTGSWKKSLHHTVYHRNETSMPEGDLKNLSKWNRSDTEALKLTMTEPQKLYLRGAVYETYDGTAWTPLAAADRAEYESLFYWLHQSGFYGQSQIGTASGFTTQTEPEKLTVENVAACSAHGYYPYALAGSGSLEKNRIGDDAFPETDAMEYYSGSVPQWYEVQHLLASAQGRSNVSEYLDREEAYKAYVTETDLQLTNESWSVLDRQLGKEKAPKTLSQIREFIREWLDENLVYDETVRTLNGSGDFLQYTLERSGSGYSVHYATAATLMLRYFGVPARYAEGYFLSAGEAARYQSGETIVLTENHAHAWAEYYLPGVGFVPFEVTPGYVDDEELELGGSLWQNEQIYTGDHLKYARVEQPERIEEPKQDRFAFSMKPVYLIWLLLAVVLLLTAVILIRRKRFRRVLLAIDSLPNRDAISLRFGYALRLMKSCGGLTVAGEQQARELNREALFSNHEMTQQQRSEMDAYAQRVLQTCKEIWTIPQKLRYKLWDCLY